jgi:hypothetical protein
MPVVWQQLAAIAQQDSIRPSLLHHPQPPVLLCLQWQHASIYPGFILSGLIDILSLFMDLPRGAQHVGVMVGGSGYLSVTAVELGCSLQ